ncbi:hypothetical protein ACFVVU_10085 [Kitasatospora sp. NPDC057965]|uniref:hypothetical protein n=1 Tax=Kitasatospora sp. NPDC057965 TaxID=3346291 RepID=UPI0036DD1CAA
MNALQQHLLDSHRAARHAEPAPPVPGARDIEVLRAVRDHRRFRAVLAGRPATGRLRAALRRALGRDPRSWARTGWSAE